MPKAKKLSSLIRSIKKRNRYADLVGYIYPEHRRVAILEKVRMKGVEQPVDRWYIADIPKDVRIGYEIYPDPTGRGSQNDRVWRVVLHDVDMLGVGEIEAIRLIGNNLSEYDREHGVFQNMIVFEYTNGLRLEDEAKKNADQGFFYGNVVFQGEYTWSRGTSIGNTNPDTEPGEPSDAIRILWG